MSLRDRQHDDDSTIRIFVIHNTHIYSANTGLYIGLETCNVAYQMLIACHAHFSVELRAVGHSAKAIIVDISPPLPGLVYDGNGQSGDIVFQSSSTKYCASWHDFRDPESGICKCFSV